MNRAVFLDCDDTLIVADTPVTAPDQVRLIQGSASAVASLRGLGYRIVVMSNQPAVADGSLTEAQVDAIHQRVADQARRSAAAEIDRFYYCPYDPDAPQEQYRREHAWRLPQPGMLHQAAEDMELDLSACWVVGPAEAHVQAGQATGARTILLRDRPDTPNGKAADPPPDFMAGTLVEAVRLIAQHVKPDAGADLMATTTDTPSEDPTPAPLAAPTTEVGGDERPADPTSDRRARPGRPFRPWSIQPVVQDTDTESPAPTAASAPTEAPPSPPDGAESAPSLPRRAADIPSPESPPATVPANIDGRTNELLSAILRQVKTRRAEEGDFSLFKLGAMLMQLFAVACVALGLMNTADVDVFTRFLLGGIFLQLAVITLLVADSRQ